MASKISQHLAKDIAHHSKHKSRNMKEKGHHRFEVEQADGGYMVTHHKPTDSMGYEPGEKSVHKTISSVAKHMKECCGGNETVGGGEEKHAENMDEEDEK